MFLHADLLVRNSLTRVTVEDLRNITHLFLLSACPTGSVICIETVRVDVPRGDWATAKDTKCNKWEDQQVKDRVYFVRIFYLPGEPKEEHMGQWFFFFFFFFFFFLAVVLCTICCLVGRHGDSTSLHWICELVPAPPPILFGFQLSFLIFFSGERVISLPAPFVLVCVEVTATRRLQSDCDVCVSVPWFHFRFCGFCSKRN